MFNFKHHPFILSVITVGGDGHCERCLRDLLGPLVNGVKLIEKKLSDIKREQLTQSILFWTNLRQVQDHEGNGTRPQKATRACNVYPHNFCFLILIQMDFCGGITMTSALMLVGLFFYMIYLL
jgi:hypothetical protein